MKYFNDFEHIEEEAEQLAALDAAGHNIISHINRSGECEPCHAKYLQYLVDKADQIDSVAYYALCEGPDISDEEFERRLEEICQR